MKKVLTVIATILLFPFVFIGFIVAIPTRSFVEGFKVCNNMIDGKI